MACFSAASLASLTARNTFDVIDVVVLPLSATFQVICVSF